MRDRACSAGDGMSCRKLACNAADTQAANELWNKGCKDGDSVSCTLANATKPQPAAVPAQPETKRSRRPGVGSALLGFAVVAGTGAVFLALADEGDNGDRGYWRPHALTMAGAGTSTRSTPSPRILPIALGATAAVAAVAGVTLLGWQPDPGPGKVAVGVTPTGLTLSGNLP